MNNKFIEKKIDNFEGITTFQLNYKCRLHLNIGYVELKRLKTKDTDTLFLCILHQSNEYSDRNPGFLFLEDNSFIIRINNSENIQLGRPTIDRKSGQESHYDYHYDYNYQEKKSYNWYKEWYTYEITPEQLQKICEADMVAIKVNNNVYDDKDFQHLFLEHCKLFYNGTYDSTLYIDTIKNQYKKEKQEQEQEDQEEQEALLAQKKERIKDILLNPEAWMFIIFALFILYAIIYYGIIDNLTN